MLNPELAKEIEEMVAEKAAKPGRLLLRTNIDGETKTVDISDYQIQIIYRLGNMSPYLIVARHGATEYKLAARPTEEGVYKELADMLLKCNTGTPVESYGVK